MRESYHRPHQKQIAVGAKRPPLPQPLERRGTLRLPVEEVAFEVRQGDDRQVRRLISAPVVEPESVAETVASSHSPLALHRGSEPTGCRWPAPSGQRRPGG